MLELKSTEELYLMALEIDAKFAGKMTCAAKKDKKKLINLDRLI